MSEAQAAISQPLLVLDKIVKILDAFTLEQPALALSELRDRTGLPASTLQRLVANLVAHEFLDRRDNILRISPRMSYWAAPASRGAEVVDVIRPVLERLRDQTGETAAFYRPSQGYRVCVALAETHHSLRRSMRVGQVLPLTAGSAGHVILAWRPDLVEEGIARGDELQADMRKLSGADLQSAITAARANGFASTVDQREVGACGLSAPVFDAQAELIGAVSVIGPTVRISALQLQEWVPTVVSAAETATRMVGGRLPTEQ